MACSLWVHDKRICPAVLFALLLLVSVSGWVTHINRQEPRQGLSFLRMSSPFEADFYENPYYRESLSSSSLAVPPDTKLVIGLNKYSHDTSICAADARTGDILFAVSKERLSRKKHDAGNVATLVESCLEALELNLDDIETVVMNNHHHRILPLERNIRHLEWECGLRINGGVEDGYDEEENLLTNVANKLELSHHFAHAYSTASQAPFKRGLCVVMDGMGETFRTMMDAAERHDESYVSEISLFGLDSFKAVPNDISEKAKSSVFDWREAESVYVFMKNETNLEIRPVFKRFVEEKSPPVLYNHGFENMESIGAVYSRASSHIFGDWNACGKVMGLAPWACYTWNSEGKELAPKLHSYPIMAGSLQSNDPETMLSINNTLLEGTPFIARQDPDLFKSDGSVRKRYDFDDDDDDEADVAQNEDDLSTKRLPLNVALDAIALAHRVQIDLECVVMDFVRHFKDETCEENLCLAGGVALNSVLNGRLARELGFKQTFVSPYPGDDGIAVGCCAYGLFGPVSSNPSRASTWNGPHAPYLGPDPTEADIKLAIEEAAPWIQVETMRKENALVTAIAEEVASGGVVALFRSRSELGPRALGHRSILADPRKKGLVRFINEHVKSRESFRPFAPSVLAEEAPQWFDLGEQVSNDNNVSPFMSMTAMVHPEKRSLIPAVTHVDGSSRLQTVTKDAESLYHKLISKFFELTGIPMVLNTSFNTLPSEPIVETPKDAIRSFLYSMGAIEMLVLGDYVIKRKPPDLKKLLGVANRQGDLKSEPACPKRAGRAFFESSFDLCDGPNDEASVETITRVRIPDRPMHGSKNEWFNLLDELEGELLSVCDGTVTLNQIIAQYTTLPEGEKRNMEETQIVLQNIVHRLVRLYEHTLISW